MRLALRSKPKTLADRARAVGDDAIGFAKSVPERVQGGGKRAVAIAGAATGVVAGLAFWRRGKGESEVQPAASRPVAPPPPVSAPKTKKPVTDTKAAAASAAGTRSK